MNKEQLIDFYTSNNVEMPNICCKDCGKLLIYDGADVHINSRDNTKLVHSGITFLSSKEYGGNTYNLCRCRECVEKKYPQVKNVRFLYAQKAAFYTQYAFDVPDDIFKQYAKERQSITKDGMIAKYGEDEGLRRWNSYCKKQSDTNTFEYKHEKYGMTLDEFKEFNKSRACTKELFIKRYGEIDGSQKWDNYCERQRYTTQPEYFIEKYGEELGKQKFQKFLDERISVNGYSKEANLLFDMLSSMEELQGHECYYYNSPYEYTVGNYKVDFYDKTANVVVEFYGDVWHANPKIYKKGDVIKFLNITIDVSKKWGLDQKRQQYIEKTLGCKFVIIWESEIKHCSEKMETLNNICNIIKNNIILYNGNTIK